METWEGVGHGINLTLKVVDPHLELPLGHNGFLKPWIDDILAS